MAEVFDPPKSIKVPEINFGDFKGYEKKCAEFRAKLKEFLINRKPNGELVGETILIPMADSHAEYMVMSLKPVQLVHVPLMDAWDSEYARLMTAKSIRDHVKRDEALKSLFSKKEKTS